MNVAELIEQLQAFPSDTRVVIYDADTSWLLLNVTAQLGQGFVLLDGGGYGEDNTLEGEMRI